ncbi:MAG: hypothetical protein IPG96_06805 [Proteobacteria bacterium]|nr:hypothetical protein [Pseudomonadota bacterium]
MSTLRRPPAPNRRTTLVPQLGSFGLLLALPALLAAPPAFAGSREGELALRLQQVEDRAAGSSRLPDTHAVPAFDAGTYRRHLRSADAQRRAVLPARSGSIAGVLHWPSISLRPEELITDQRGLEDRLAWKHIGWAQRGVPTAAVTSHGVPQWLHAYRLGLLRPSDRETAEGALRYLSPRPHPDPKMTLSQKALIDPAFLAEVREWVAQRGGIVPLDSYNTTRQEWRVAQATGALPSGPLPHQRVWGGKDRGFDIFDEAGLPRLPTTPLVRDPVALTDSVLAMLRAAPGARKVMLKIPDSSAGGGNRELELPEGFATASASEQEALVRESLLRGPNAADGSSAEDWQRYRAEAQRAGVFAELFGDAKRAPSFQGCVQPDGSVEAISTHLQGFADPQDPRRLSRQGTVYRGGQYPAPPEDRWALQAIGLATGQELARRGIFGPFGVDTLITPSGIVVLETNLRTVGNTGPQHALRTLVPGRYDLTQGAWISAASRKPMSYMTADRVTAQADLLGLDAQRAIEVVRQAGLEFDHRRETGVALYMLPMLAINGQLGATAIAHSPEEADEMFQETARVLTRAAQQPPAGRALH